MIIVLLCISLITIPLIVVLKLLKPIPLVLYFLFFFLFVGGVFSYLDQIYLIIPILGYGSLSYLILMNWIKKQPLWQTPPTTLIFTLQLLLGVLSFGIPFIVSAIQFLADDSLSKDKKFIAGLKLYETPKKAFKELKKILKNATGIDLGIGVRIPKELEVFNTIFVGGMGSGKTTTLLSIIEQISNRKNEPTTIFDFKGDYTEIFFDDSTILLSPLDFRSQGWDIGADVRTEADAQEFARNLVHSSLDSGHDGSNFFALAAIDCITGAIVACQKEHKNWNFGHLTSVLNDQKKIIAKLQQFRPAALLSLADSDQKDGGKQSAGVFGTIRVCTQVLEIFSKSWDTKKEKFSVHSFLTEPGQKKMLILRFIERYSAVSQFFVTQILTSYFQTVMSLPDDVNRRIHTFLDELGVLQTISSLPSILKVGRSKGHCIWGGLQEVSSIDTRYKSYGGKETILNGFSNRFIGRAETEEFARYWSESFGITKFERKNKQTSVSGSNTSKSTSKIIVEEHLISSGELLALPVATKEKGGEFFLKLAGSPYVFKLCLPIQFTNKKAEALILEPWLTEDSFSKPVQKIPEKPRF